MAALDYEAAATLLADFFFEAEKKQHEGKAPTVSTTVEEFADLLFASSTQSYREVLLGCCLVRLLDSSVDIRQPYVGQSERAYNGRTLDERVVNPFLQDRLIPCSKGPYLASFRRQVKFVPETVKGLRDKAGYDALLGYIGVLEEAKAIDAKNLTIYLLVRFLELRNRSQIPLSHISRLSLDQYGKLLQDLLQVQSGGLLPVLLVVAMLKTIKSCYSLKWDVQFQGINVSDKASGVGGDVTVSLAGETVLAIEVTERPIEKSRVVSTFNTKVIRAGIQDYLFVYSNAIPSEDARKVARTYFSQGHEINFVQVTDWITNNLATVGAKGRATFTKEVLTLLDSQAVPASAKMAWNDIIRKIVSQ